MEDKVLETVINGLEYAPVKDVLVKPLEPIMVEKEVAVGTGEKDIDGYEKMTTEKQTVESDFALGIILAMPLDTHSDTKFPFAVGDKVVYPKKFAKDFDLFKSSQLVKPYDIVGIKVK